MNNTFTKLGTAFVCLLLTTTTFAQQTVQNKLPKWAFGGFTRPANVNPIISPDVNSKFLDPMSDKRVGWEAFYTFNPAATVKNGRVVVLYRSEDMTGDSIGTRTSRIGYAESSDGLTFKRSGKPVLYPGDDSQKEFEWPGGCEDPRVAVTEDGTYVMFYTQWNRKVPRLGVATSKDLKTWVKHGPIFRKFYNGKYADIPNKSASILTQLKNGKVVIAKVNGKYWMYWGELHVFAATSTNLVDWKPVTNTNGELKWLISPRKGYFDSDLTECGPPALLTKNGIILFYNGKNHPGDGGDKRFNGNSYCAGQVLFSLKDPTKAIARLDVPFLRPMEPFEKSGQYVNGTVFIEGLVYFKQKWFLYYGCADSKVGVAVYDPNKPSKPDPLPVL
ncbi:glycoside hydrolase family 130 protein [Mucilaginibacter sp. KACC 22063]|uniref:glycoside hydrolase family 130 protein n=1 Tax=Mucilaginibacter sp. KACC 22063 TaxID=3025666 RepID=UPI0023668B81|nr:glycoside hydrolase family 130 protein [Mucilaginibacter sp. KACC 22063]WDF56700.1 glycoside hydrolase family 130 protein [Mucilaginibacter sp. KACC 22063]